MLLRDSEREIKKVWGDDLCHLFLISDNHLLIFPIWGTDMSFLSDISLFFSEKYWRYLLWWKSESFEVSVTSVDHTVSILIRWSFLSKKCSSWLISYIIVWMKVLLKRAAVMQLHWLTFWQPQLWFASWMLQVRQELNDSY